MKNAQRVYKSAVHAILPKDRNRSFAKPAPEIQDPHEARLARFDPFELLQILSSNEATSEREVPTL